MLGQRQVTDGKVKSSFCLFYFDWNLLFFYQRLSSIFIRPVNMCGKRMKKFTRRSWGLDQPSEASVLTRWETNADLPVSMLRFLFWFWKCMPSMKTMYMLAGGSLWDIWIQLSRMGYGHAGDLILLISPRILLWGSDLFFLPGMQQSRNMLCPTVWHPRYVLHSS